MDNRYKASERVSVLGVLGNIFLFCIKIIVGLISHSESMIADAFNSASDVFNSVMTYIGNKISSASADDDHNLGHGKAEYIFSMLISITMILLSLSIFKDSFLLLFHNSKYEFNSWLIVVCIVTIITKLSLYIYTSSIGKKYNNLLVVANSKDHRNDCFITLVNLISIILAKFNFVFFDSIGGMLISLWILITGVSIFKESYDILMDKTISSETKDKVLDIIKEYDEVKKINHFNATPVGYQYQISFTIFVDGKMSTFKSHDIANRLEKEIDEKVPEIYLTVIHVNPIDIKD